MPIWLDVSDDVLKDRIQNREDAENTDINVLGFQLKKGRPDHYFVELDGEAPTHVLADTLAGMLCLFISDFYLE